MLPEKLLTTAAATGWQKIGPNNHHGFCLPLFSLHSEESCGIGEYLDLIPMIHFCKEVGMDVIQLLPLNDPGLDTSPYNALSAFALNPVHLSISQLPNIERVPNYDQIFSKLRYWNGTSRVKHHIVRELKLTFLRSYFDVTYAEVHKTEGYQNFLSNNPWLQPYALFKALKEKMLWKSWEDWPSHLKSPSDQGFTDLFNEHLNTCQFHIFLQYYCFEQLEKVKQIATEQNVLLKGDIPILISRDSADVWHHRHLFFLHFAAGAPPDMYSKEGQYWGFPLYDWEEMEKGGYQWWKERLRIASHLYHLYRIDHVVGFFRIWAIPLEKPAREGSFIPQGEHEWIPHGNKIMEMMLKAAPILPIGEDLGLVPPSVKEALYSLGICGTKMMRWERRWETDGGFIPIEQYQPMTMSTVSTHDSDTLQLWWRHFPKEAKLYSEFKKWAYHPFLTPEHHEQILRDSHHSSSLFHINLLQEYLALFPDLVSKNPNNERINIPGKILDTNWTYRFKPSVEQITNHIPLKEKMSSIVKSH